MAHYPMKLLVALYFLFERVQHENQYTRKKKKVKQSKSDGCIKLSHTGTLIVVTLFSDLLFGIDGANNNGEDVAMGTFGKGGLNELDGEFE